MTKSALPLAAAVAVVLSGSAAFAGGVPVLNFPNLHFAPASSQELVSRDVAPDAPVCMQIEKAAGLSPEACGTLSTQDIAKLKAAQDN